ncbi:MAG: hypothetical protein ACREIT_11835 [Tepidisphaeraceae bacterium]
MSVAIVVALSGGLLVGYFVGRHHGWSLSEQSHGEFTPSPYARSVAGVGGALGASMSSTHPTAARDSALPVPAMAVLTPSSPASTMSTTYPAPPLREGAPGWLSEAERRRRLIAVRFVRFEPGLHAGRSTFELTNLTGRYVLSVKGCIVLYDQFGDRVEGLGVFRETALAPGVKSLESGNWPLAARTKELLSQPLPGSELFFEPYQIVYTDGQQDNFR